MNRQNGQKKKKLKGYINNVLSFLAENPKIKKLNKIHHFQKVYDVAEDDLAWPTVSLV